EVSIFTGDLGEVMETHPSRQPDQQLPVLEEGQTFIERADLGQQPARDRDGVEGDVVVDEQQVGIEVAGVGNTPLDLLPTLGGERVGDDGGVDVGDLDPCSAACPRQGLQVLGV